MTDRNQDERRDPRLRRDLRGVLPWSIIAVTIAAAIAMAVTGVEVRDLLNR
jgi:hypothetical protein